MVACNFWKSTPAGEFLLENDSPSRIPGRWSVEGRKKKDKASGKKAREPALAGQESQVQAPQGGLDNAREPHPAPRAESQNWQVQGPREVPDRHKQGQTLV